MILMMSYVCGFSMLESTELLTVHLTADPADLVQFSPSRLCAGW